MLHRILLPLFLLAASASALAQPVPNIRIASKGAWTADCTPEAQTGEKWCQAGTVLRSSNPPYSLEFNYVRDSRMFFARGSMPLSGVHAQVEGHSVFDFDRCLAGMCLLKGAPADQLLTQMRAGGRLMLRFDTRAQLPGPLTVDLADFDAMYRAALAAPK
ncbi:invasion associated locus B family protein [Enhydrobacter aerosaccus]|nr:invasion associated locus B family protein [Enhydrobacter aerosaccus]